MEEATFGMRAMQGEPNFLSGTFRAPLTGATVAQPSVSLSTVSLSTVFMAQLGVPGGRNDRQAPGIYKGMHGVGKLNCALTMLTFPSFRLLTLVLRFDFL